MIPGCVFRPGHCTIQSTLLHVMTETIWQMISAPPEIPLMAKPPAVTHEAFAWPK